MITIFGIKQCSSMQKAFKWLDAHQLPYEFHDYKKLGIDAARLQDWCSRLGWTPLLNTRGTTWRKLPESERANLTEEKAIGLMLANPSLIKRPVIRSDALLLVGFDEARFAAELENE